MVFSPSVWGHGASAAKRLPSPCLRCSNGSDQPPGSDFLWTDQQSTCGPVLQTAMDRFDKMRSLLEQADTFARGELAQLTALGAEHAWSISLASGGSPSRAADPAVAGRPVRCLFHGGEKSAELMWARDGESVSGHEADQLAGKPNGQLAKMLK